VLRSRARLVVVPPFPLRGRARFAFAFRSRCASDGASRHRL